MTVRPSVKSFGLLRSSDTILGVIIGEVENSSGNGGGTKLNKQCVNPFAMPSSSLELN